MCIYIAVRLSSKKEPGKQELAIIPVSRNLDRFISLPGQEGYSYMLLEDAICCMIKDFFPGTGVLEAVPFRITRNADLKAREDLTPDFLAEMESVLSQRKISDCVRLEICGETSKTIARMLQKLCEVTSDDTYYTPGPLDLSAFSELAGIDTLQNLRYPTWDPQPSPDVDMSNSIFDEISRGDILLCHPFESYEPVLKMIEEAADDPDVLAIKPASS